MCTTLPFGWNESPFCYHSLSEVRRSTCASGSGQCWHTSTTHSTPHWRRGSGRPRERSGWPFRVPKDKLRKLHGLIQTALDDGEVPAQTLEKIAGKCMSMSAAIRPASLWTHFMFAAIAKARGRVIALANKHDLREELKIWLRLSTTSQRGPWYKERHYDVRVTSSYSDASANQWGGVIDLPSGLVRHGRRFSPLVAASTYQSERVSRLAGAA